MFQVLTRCSLFKHFIVYSFLSLVVKQQETTRWCEITPGHKYSSSFSLESICCPPIISVFDVYFNDEQHEAT